MTMADPPGMKLPLRELGDVLVNPRSHAGSSDCMWGNLPVRFAWCALVVLAGAGSVHGQSTCPGCRDPGSPPSIGSAAENGTVAMSPEIKAQLAPHGVLRAAINMSNFLLVTGRSASGDPEGVSPSMARAIADALGVGVKYVPFPKPGELADEAGKDVWDIGLIGAEPARAEKIAFTAAYTEIEATYLVPAGSPLKAIADVDKPGVRIAVTARSAYGLWLDRNIKQATLVQSSGLDSAFDQFVAEKLEALAGLRPRLLSDVQKLPGAAILPGQFTAVQQAVGTAKVNVAAAAWLHTFVEEAKASGLVAKFIEQHKVVGLSVAPPG
jgi:polar amino acid transport system substrate-binding protein